MTLQPCDQYRCLCGNHDEYKFTTRFRGLIVRGYGERLFVIKVCDDCGRATVIGVPSGIPSIPRKLRQWFPQEFHPEIGEGAYRALIELLLIKYYLSMLPRSQEPEPQRLLAFLMTTDPNQEKNDCFVKLGARLASIS